VKKYHKGLNGLEVLVPDHGFTCQRKVIEYKIERFSDIGELECSKLFKVDKTSFDINSEYKFTYLSHCSLCTIIQNQITFKFKAYENNNV
jgi:hypothetical protein